MSMIFFIKKIRKIFNSEILLLPLEELSQDETIYINKIEAFLNTFIDKNDLYPENKKFFYRRWCEDI